jgi:hypothetical protein
MGFIKHNKEIDSLVTSTKKTYKNYLSFDSLTRTILFFAFLVSFSIFFFSFSNLINLLPNFNSISNVLGVNTDDQPDNTFLDLGGNLYIDSSSNNFGPKIQNNLLNYFSVDIGSKDFRAFVFDEYFRINNSPLYGTGQIFVDKCIQYNAPKDCMIVVAIAQAETDLCKYFNSAEMYNCWGFGGPDQYRIRFNNFYEAIDRVYYSLVFYYGIRYILQPNLMQNTFCGNGPECVNWANNVLFAQNQINNFAIQLGFPSLYSLR